MFNDCAFHEANKALLFFLSPKCTNASVFTHHCTANNSNRCLTAISMITIHRFSEFPNKPPRICQTRCTNQSWGTKARALDGANVVVERVAAAAVLRRRHGRGPADRARRVRLEPLADALVVEAVAAARQLPERLVLPHAGEADAALVGTGAGASRAAVVLVVAEPQERLGGGGRGPGVRRQPDDHDDDVGEAERVGDDVRLAALEDDDEKRHEHHEHHGEAPAGQRRRAHAAGRAQQRGQDGRGLRVRAHLPVRRRRIVAAPRGGAPLDGMAVPAREAVEEEDLDGEAAGEGRGDVAVVVVGEARGEEQREEGEGQVQPREVHRRRAAGEAALIRRASALSSARGIHGPWGEKTEQDSVEAPVSALNFGFFLRRTSQEKLINSGGKD
jgi:hypothetical protein